MKPLEGRIAVVAGATRGAGRGIACMLGEAGATVYCTGRSVRGKPAGSRPETIEETAELVTARGGRGLAVRVDHLEEAEVEALFARVRQEQGRLDVVVNDIWGGDDLVDFARPGWEQSPATGLALFTSGVHTHVVTSRYGVPLLLEGGAGLVVEITDGDSAGYRGCGPYDLVKSAVIRLAYGLAADLAHHGHTRVTALALTPGFLRSEAMLDRFGVTEANWRDAIAQDPFFAESETPFFVGRAVAALAADPEVHRRAGRAWSSWELARAYDFDDVDGRRPDWGRHFAAATEALLGGPGPLDPGARFLLEHRYYQVHQDPAQTALARRLYEVLAASGAPPLPLGE